MLTAERTHREEGQSCAGVHTGTPAEDTRHKHSHGVHTQDYKKEGVVEKWVEKRSYSTLVNLWERTKKMVVEGGGLMEPKFSSSDGVVKDGCRRDADVRGPCCGPW